VSTTTALGDLVTWRGKWQQQEVPIARDSWADAGCSVNVMIRTSLFLSPPYHGCVCHCKIHYACS
jgi:hypothetical protein